MKKVYYAGRCPICGNYGDMEVVYCITDGRCTVVCEECMIEFDTPDDYARARNGYRHSREKAQSRAATIDEIAATEWYIFVKSYKRNYTEGNIP